MRSATVSRCGSSMTSVRVAGGPGSAVLAAVSAKVPGAGVGVGSLLVGVLGEVGELMMDAV